MTITIRDVAQACGVHVSTVSRTFSAPHLVNAETRGRVLAAAQELGYRPNRAARALITGRTHNLGMIVSDLANPFFAALIKAAEARARGSDYYVFVADCNEDPVTEAELVGALSRQVDGILLCGPRMTNELIVEFSREVPLVLVNRQVDGLPAVVMDVGQGTRDAIAHLAELGHRHLALLSGPRGSWTSREIRRACGAAVRSSELELTVIGPNDPSEAAGADAVDAVVRAGATGVLAYNDLMAIGLLEGLRERGLRVPADMSVVGIDDVAASRLVRPKLTTLATPAAVAGRAAVEMLLQETTSGRSTAQLTLQTELVIRDSTGPRPAPDSQPGALSSCPTALHVKE